MAKYVDQNGLDRFYDNIADRPVQAFDTVAAMQAATYLEAGMTCHTNGNATVGDGGAAYYKVAASGDIALQGGLYATAVQGTQTQRVSILSPVLEGSAVLISDGANSVLMDCGYTSDTSRLESFFAEHQDPIDCLVISHFDSDHFGGFATVAKHLTSSTDIYIQMSPTSANGSYTTYTNALTTLASIVSQYGLKQPVVPSEGLIKRYGNISIELHNTTATNAATYDATNGDSSSLTTPTSNLNNYSLISIITIGDKIITYSGDIEAVAQRLNAAYMPKADVAFVPHHLSNKWGNLEWHTNQDPEIWVATTAASTFEGDIWYLWRYFYTLYLNKFIDNVYYSHNKALEIEFVDGCLSKIDGDTFKVALENDPPSHELSLYNILSPYYESDNPHILYEISLADLMTAIKNAKSGPYFKSGTSENQTNFAFFQELLTIFGSQSFRYEGLNAEFCVDGGVLTVRFNTSSLYYDTIVVYGNVSVANDTGYRLQATNMARKHVFSTAITANAYDLTQDFDIATWLATANEIVVRTSGGAFVHCFRTVTAADYFNVTAVSFQGVSMNTAMTTLYRVVIESSGKITGTSRTFDSATLSYMSIAAMQAM